MTVLALLRKRNRQTNRIMFVQVSAKNLGYGDLPGNAGEPWGEANTVPCSSIARRTLPPPSGRWANALGYASVVGREDEKQFGALNTTVPLASLYNTSLQSNKTPPTKKSENPPPD